MKISILKYILNNRKIIKIKIFLIKYLNLKKYYINLNNRPRFDIKHF